MKYNEEYIKIQKAVEASEMIYKLGVGCGVFLFGVSAIILSFSVLLQ